MARVDRQPCAQDGDRAGGRIDAVVGAGHEFLAVAQPIVVGVGAARVRAELALEAVRDAVVVGIPRVRGAFRLACPHPEQEQTAAAIAAC